MAFEDSPHHGRIGSSFPRLTPGVKLLLLVNLAGFLFNNLLTVGKFSTFLGLSFDGLIEGYGLGMLRVLSYQFIHSLSLSHIVWNMIWLYMFGTMIEGHGGGIAGRLGKIGLIKLYLLSGVVGGLMFVALSAMFGQFSTPVIGASGAGYGVMMFAACVDPRRPISLILFSIELRYLVGFLIFVGLYSSYINLVQGAGGDGTAHSAHLGGALGGYLFYKVTMARGAVSEVGPIAWWRRRAEQRNLGAARKQQETLDKILEKVHERGMTGLSAAERRFLERVSKQQRK